MSEINLSPLLITKNIKPNCTYSVYLETPHLKLLCYINGPYFSTNINLNESKMQLNISIKIPSYIENEQMKRNIPVMEEKLKNILIRHILTGKYLRSKLDIVIEIYEIDCDYFPYALMATSICCNYANLEQRGILTCCTLLLDKEQNIISDPLLSQVNDKEKSKDYLTKFTIGYNIPLKETVAFFQDGSCQDNNILIKVIATSIKICETYNSYILNKF